MNRSAATLFAAATVFAAGCAGSSAAKGPVDTPAPNVVEVHAAQLPSDHAFTINTTTAKAGQVTFSLVNDAKVEHELIILRTDEAFDQLPVAADHRVSEDASVGEISETAAGKRETKSFDLSPGKYVLVCNIALHYGQGMRLAFTVTP